MSTPTEDSPIVAARLAAQQAFKVLAEAKRLAKYAEEESRAARQNAESAAKAAGRSLRGLRHALDVTLNEVARAADHGWSPPNTLPSYVEVEDGITVDETRAVAAWEYLKKRAARVLPPQEPTE